MSLILSCRFRNQMIAEARREFPEECCGMLLGRRSRRDAIVRLMIPAANDYPGDRRIRHRLDDSVLIRAVQVSVESGELIGFYHSHPHSSVEPSGFDLAWAWEGFSYVILSLHDRGKAEFACWRFDPRNRSFIEEPLHSPASHALVDR